MTHEDFLKIFDDDGLEGLGKFYGLYRGEVSSNEDPDFMGRIQVKVPALFGDDVPPYWAPPMGMFSGKNIGLFAIPNQGDSVWVVFENGDPRFPVWTYGPFREKEVPQDSKVDGNKPSNKVFRTTSGHQIELDDKNEWIRITDKHGNRIVMNDKGISNITDKKIFHGKLNTADEPHVLGDKLESHLLEMLDDIGNLGMIQTNTGITGLISTSPGWVTFKTKWTNKFKTFKSNKVFLDK